eukprot:3885323-Amphidinium_carterae.2
MLTMIQQQPQIVPPQITTTQPPPMSSMNVNISSCAASAKVEPTSLQHGADNMLLWPLWCKSNHFSYGTQLVDCAAFPAMDALLGSDGEESTLNKMHMIAGGPAKWTSRLGSTAAALCGPVSLRFK